MNLTPEQYKTLAEFAGHKVCESFDFVPDAGVTYIGRCAETAIGGYCERYTPDTNDSQAWELEDKLIEEGYIVHQRKGRFQVYRPREHDWETICDFGQYDAPMAQRRLLICHAILAIGGEG